MDSPDDPLATTSTAAGEVHPTPPSTTRRSKRIQKLPDWDYYDPDPWGFPYHIRKKSPAVPMHGDNDSRKEGVDLENNHLASSSTTHAESHPHPPSNKRRSRRLEEVPRHDYDESSSESSDSFLEGSEVSSDETWEEPSRKSSPDSSPKTSAESSPEPAMPIKLVMAKGKKRPIERNSSSERDSEERADVQSDSLLRQTHETSSECEESPATKRRISGVLTLATPAAAARFGPISVSCIKERLEKYEREKVVAEKQFSKNLENIKVLQAALGLVPAGREQILQSLQILQVKLPEWEERLRILKLDTKAYLHVIEDMEYYSDPAINPYVSVEDFLSYHDGGKRATEKQISQVSEKIKVLQAALGLVPAGREPIQEKLDELQGDQKGWEEKLGETEKTIAAYRHVIQDMES